MSAGVVTSSAPKRQSASSAVMDRLKPETVSSVETPVDVGTDVGDSEVKLASGWTVKSADVGVNESW